MRRTPPLPPSPYRDDSADDGREHSAMYRIAYEQGLRTLDDQRDELNGIRGRAGSYMALVGSATAFLVGTTLRGATTDPGSVFFYVAIAGSVSFIIALAFLAVLLAPGYQFNFRQSPKFLVEQYINRDVPGPSEAELLERMSLDLEKFIGTNEDSLKKLRVHYRTIMVSGGISLLIWTSAIWVFGRVGV